MQIIDFLFLSLLSSILKIIRVIIIKPEIVYLSLLFSVQKRKFSLLYLLLLIFFNISF